jgi:hypothetical protein
MAGHFFIKMLSFRPQKRFLCTENVIFLIQYIRKQQPIQNISRKRRLSCVLSTMKNLVYLLFLFPFVGSSFTYDVSDRKQHATASIMQTLALDVKVEQPKSASSNDGVMHLSVSGGTAPYTIQVISTFSPAQVYTKDRVDIKKLGVGNYIIMVQDAEKHVLQKTIELTAVQ